MSLKHKLDTYTKLSINERVKAIKWLARQNEDLHLIAFQKQKDFIFELSKIEEEDKSILYLSAYYLAADALYTLLNTKNTKNKALNLHQVEDHTKLQVKQFKKHVNSEKYDKLLNLKNKIKRLIEIEKLSYREVSIFLKKYHRFEVSHSYIATFYQKMKEKK